MKEVAFFVEKIEGGFIVTCPPTGDEYQPRKIVRKLSEVVTLLKEAMKDEVQ